MLSSGAVLYIGVLSFGMLVQGERTEARQIQSRSSLVRVGGNNYPVQHDRQFGFLAGPLGEFRNE